MTSFAHIGKVTHLKKLVGIADDTVCAAYSDANKWTHLYS